MLRHFFAFLLVALVTCGLLINDAEARRFGGGRSFGYSRSSSSFSKPSSAFSNSAYSRPQSPFRQGSTASRWFGPIAGLLTGGLLASLFMSHGLGSGLMSWLLVGGLLFIVVTMWKNKRQQANPQYQPYQDSSNQFARDAAAQFMRNASQQAHSTASNTTSNIYPIGFDASAFLRDAKVQFIRMQAAYDQKNLSDIREFTTPEVFAEIQLQLQERGNTDNHTNVMTLEAELLDVENASQLVAGADMQTMLASVRFNALIQENRDEPAANTTEIWHFKKEIANQRWLVAGVQQQ